MLKKVFEGFWGNLKGFTTRKAIVWQLVAIIATYFLVQSGFDWWYYESTRSLLFAGLPAGIVGFFVPILVPLILLIISQVKKIQRLELVAYAIAKAEILAFVVSVIYKIFTGRIQPEFYTNLSNVDISHAFNFGFFRHGIFWGWPSSHTAVAFALAFVVWNLFPQKQILRYVTIIYAVYICFGTSISIHWLSDSLAGAIVGTIAGTILARKMIKNDN